MFPEIGAMRFCCQGVLPHFCLGKFSQYIVNTVKLLIHYQLVAYIDVLPQVLDNNGVDSKHDSFHPLGWQWDLRVSEVYSVSLAPRQTFGCWLKSMVTYMPFEICTRLYIQPPNLSITCLYFILATFRFLLDSISLVATPTSLNLNQARALLMLPLLSRSSRDHTFNTFSILTAFYCHMS